MNYKEKIEQLDLNDPQAILWFIEEYLCTQLKRKELDFLKVTFLKPPTETTKNGLYLSIYRDPVHPMFGATVQFNYHSCCLHIAGRDDRSVYLPIAQIAELAKRVATLQLAPEPLLIKADVPVNFVKDTTQLFFLAGYDKAKEQKLKTVLESLVIGDDRQGEFIWELPGTSVEPALPGTVQALITVPTDAERKELIAAIDKPFRDTDGKRCLHEELSRPNPTTYTSAPNRF